MAYIFNFFFIFQREIFFSPSSSKLSSGTSKSGTLPFPLPFKLISSSLQFKKIIFGNAKSDLRIFQRFLQMFFEQKVFSYYQRNRENLAPWIFLPSPIFELVSLFSFSRPPVYDQPLVKQLCSKIFLTRLKQKVTFSYHGAPRFILLLKKG